MQCVITEKQYYHEAHGSQIVRDTTDIRFTLEPSLNPRPDLPSYNERGTIEAKNLDCVYNQTCRLLHDIHVIFFITFNYLFKLFAKIRLSNNSFEFIN